MDAIKSYSFDKLWPSGMYVSDELHVMHIVSATYLLNNKFSIS